jgi:alpha-1,2-mannosyltransferase
VALLGAFPVLVLLLLLITEWNDRQVAADFHWGLYPQARALLHSGVPFDPPGATIDGQNSIYTVFAALAAAPFTLVTVGVADVLVTAGLVAAALGALYVVGVRDWRVFGVILLWPPVLSAIQTGNLTLVLCLLAALAWRYRHRRLAPGVLVGLAFALKVLVWPLAVWLLATRRFAAAAASFVVGAGSILLILPFGSPIAYFELVHRTADIMARGSFSIYLLLGADGTARLAWLAVAAIVLAAAVFVDDRSSFTLGMAGCILFSPVVWLHYFAFLVVPLAVARPRFGRLWLVPLAYWLVPFGEPTRAQILVALGAMFVIVIALVRGRAAPVRPGGARPEAA